jgi:hypothetical protein
MNVNLQDTGAEIGFACARVLALSSFSLISSLIVSGSLAVVGGFPLIEAPAHRVAKMSVILIGTSAAGCILGAWMTGAIGKNKTEVFQETTLSELATKKDTVALFVQAEKEKWAPVEARDKEIFRRGQLIRELRQQLKDREQELEAWEDWFDLVHRLDECYEVFGCKGCRYFVGSQDGGNFFVCAMHPYGKRCCEDRE